MAINIALIGVGYWGKKLLYEYLMLSKKDNRVKLSVICDANKENLVFCRDKYGIPTKNLTTEYKKVLNSDDTDAVHIATPNNTHFQIAMDAIKARKHVLLEKPMALSARDAFKLAREANKNGVILSVGHIYRFNNAVTKAKKLIEDSWIGEPRYISLRWTVKMSPPEGRDIIFDLAPHPVDVINYLFEKWPIRVYVRAESYERGRRGLEEAAFITADLPNKLIATMTLSWIHPGPKERSLTIVGSKATLLEDMLNQRITIYESGKWANVPVEVNNTIESMISHFVECVVNGHEGRNNSLIGATTVSILEHMRKSLNLVKPVDVILA